MSFSRTKPSWTGTGNLKFGDPFGLDVHLIPALWATPPPCEKSYEIPQISFQSQRDSVNFCVSPNHCRNIHCSRASPLRLCVSMCFKCCVLSDSYVKLVGGVPQDIREPCHDNIWDIRCDLNKHSAKFKTDNQTNKMYSRYHHTSWRASIIHLVKYTKTILGRCKPCGILEIFTCSRSSARRLKMGSSAPSDGQD